MHLWNESYRQKGEIHPITKFIESQMPVEQEARRKRIEMLDYQEERSQKVLAAIARYSEMYDNFRRPQ